MKRFPIWVLGLTLLACFVSSGLWAADPTNSYLGELQVYHAENVAKFEMARVMVKFGKFSLTGMGIDPTLQSNKAPAPLRPTVSFEAISGSTPREELTVKFAGDPWTLYLGCAPSRHPRMNLRFVTGAPATLFSLSMWQRMTWQHDLGSEFWAEKPANGNAPYQCLKAGFDKDGNVLYVAYYTAVDAKKKETLEVFYGDIGRNFAVPPVKGRYTFKSKGGSDMSVEIGNMFLRPHCDLRLEATIDGVTLPLILELQIDPNHFGHNLAREGAPFADVKSSYRVQVTQGLMAIALHKLDWSPGSDVRKNRAIAMGVDAQGKPLYVSSYAQTKNGNSYEMYLGQ